ncbi:MAG: hypothetical protein QOG95_3303 [Mycobacterium sp.]|jgi:hypothetical protein|nr:hypothetical protein [Mycobacterium sp.]
MMPGVVSVDRNDAMIDSFIEIRSAAGIAADLRPVDAAMPLAAAGAAD